MDEISYLIINKLKDQPYYNSASLVYLYPKDPDFVGYYERQILGGFEVLIRQELLHPHPITAGTGNDKNYMLTEKGEQAYMREKKRREAEVKREEFQKTLSESVYKANLSVIDTNSSVLATNDSVRQTNISIQELNRITSENIPRQNRLSRTNIWVAIAVGLIALATFIASFKSSPETGIIRELQENIRLLKHQDSTIALLLQKQLQIDSFHSKGNIVHYLSPGIIKNKTNQIEKEKN